MKKESCKLLFLRQHLQQHCWPDAAVPVHPQRLPVPKRQEASPRHRIRGARTEAAAEQRERFRVRLRSGIHLPRGQDWRPSRRRQTNLWKKTRM